ncbi:MAG: response regulator [Phycisphaerales bacterium]|nr:MAG: response regulator [Phycisphaerales bacterium]
MDTESMLNAPTVLLVDDERHVTEIVGRRLTAAGCHVQTACDGQAGLEAAARCQPALIITDLDMPRMTGFEFACAVQGDKGLSGTPIILLSARGFTISPAQLAQGNIQRVIEKPFSARKVVEAALSQLGLQGKAAA